MANEHPSIHGSAGAPKAHLDTNSTKDITYFGIHCNSLAQLKGTTSCSESSCSFRGLPDSALERLLSVTETRVWTPRVMGTMYSHCEPRCSHLLHVGRCKSHFVLEVVHCRQDFCRKLGAGPGVHRLACRINEDSGRG